VGWVRRSSNSTSFSPPWARAWDGHEVVDLAVGRLALHCAEENPDEVLAALDDKTEAVIRELEAQHKEGRRSLRRRRDRARGPPTLPKKDAAAGSDSMMTMVFLGVFVAYTGILGRARCPYL
jgi:hypothetical protein